LKTVDTTTGHIQTVYSADRRFEAPNWSRDGRYFLINREGRLYRLPGRRESARRAPWSTWPRADQQTITGSQPDGAVTRHQHEPTEDWLTSSVYTLPIGGGTPKRSRRRRRVSGTAGRPTARRAILGRRDGEFDITICGDRRRRGAASRPVKGSTTADYSPDGASSIQLVLQRQNGNLGSAA